MLQAGGELDLAEESFGAEGLGHFRMKHLECHRPVVAKVVREIHHRHAAAAELALDAVLAVERSLKATQSILQAGPGRGLAGRLQRLVKRRKVDTFGTGARTLARPLFYFPGSALPTIRVMLAVP